MVLGDFDPPITMGGPGWEDGNTPSPTTTSRTSRPADPTTTVRTSKPADPADPWPTVVDPDEDPYCFRNEFGSGKYQPFKPDVGERMVDQVCASSDRLNPATFGHVVSGANGLIVSITWANSQAGCAPKDFLPLGDQCRANFHYIMDWCDFGAVDDEYLGGAVTHKTQFGCVTLYIGTEQGSRALIMSPDVDTTPRPLVGEQLQEFLHMIEDLEPSLPRMEGYESISLVHLRPTSTSSSSVAETSAS